MNSGKHHRIHRKSAFSLVEVTLALGLAAFGLIAVVGLIPTGLQQVRDSSAESVGVNILSDLAAELKNSSAASSTKKISTTAGGSGELYFDLHGKYMGANASPAAAAYKASWKARGANANSGMPANVYLTVSWPPLAANPSGLAEAIVVLQDGSNLPSASSGE